MACLGMAEAAAAEAARKSLDAPTGKILRAAGDYRVESISKEGQDHFRIVFHSLKATGRFDILTLSSDHIHVAVSVGRQVRLSAEVLQESGPKAEVAQVVLFVPGAGGQVPIWLLSNRSGSRDLRAVKYLEMHVPQYDYTIL